MEQETTEPKGAVSEGVTLRPPYAPFDTVKNFIERLKTSGIIPHRIDKSVMTNLSGAAQSHLLLALRFLGLIDADGTPLVGLHELVESFGTPQWAVKINGITIPAYKQILNGLDVSKATMGQLSELFRDRGKTEGTVTEKSIRFYLKMLDEAGVKYSPHFARKRGPRGPNKRRKDATEGAGDAKGNPAVDGSVAKPPTPPTGMIAFPLHLPDKLEGSIVVPRNINEEDVKLIEAQIVVLKLYAARNTATGAKPKGEQGMK